MDSGFGLDDFLKQLNEKTTQNPIQSQSQAAKRKQRALFDKYLTQSQPTSHSQDSIIKSRENIQTTKSIQKQAPQPMSQEIEFTPPVQEVQPTLTQISKKDSLKDKLKEDLRLFENKAFVFIPYGFTFTKKQIEILSENIRKRGGKTFDVNFFDWKPLSFIDLIIITSKQIPYNNLLQIVAVQHHSSLEKFVFLDHDWVAKCLQENSLLDHTSFVINWLQPTKEPEEKPKRDIYATRYNFRSAHAVNNRRLKRNQKDTEALDQYLEEEKLEMDALNLEAELLMGAKKRVRNNNHQAQNYTYLLDFSLGLNPSQLTFREKNAGNLSPRTEIISDEEFDPKIELEEDFSSEFKIEKFAMLEEEDYEDEIQFISTKHKDDSNASSIIIFEDIKQDPFKKEANFLKSSMFQNDEELEILSTKETSNQMSDPFLEGLEMKDEKEKVKMYKTYNPLNKPSAKYWENKKDFFVCQTGTKQNFNQNITDELEKLQKVYTNEKDIGRMHAYRKAVAIIRSIPFKVESADDIKPISGIGQKIKEKMIEIVTTGKLRKAEILTNDVKQQTIETLTKVWGLGVQTAIDLFHKGLRTIDDLRKNEDLLNDNQKVGLKYFDDLQKRMPREEVQEIVKIVADRIEELADVKRVFEVICCGSYRRGKPTCGDIDILVTRKDGKPITNFLSTLIRSLEDRLLTDHLAMPKPGTYGNETYMGICRNGGLYRRIDIKLYPREQFGYALVHFTGNDFFNRSMRLFARKKGMTLSDHGLHPSIRKKQDKLWVGQNIPCYTEEEVFKAIGIQYRPPTEREV